jgi:hypothetical protein
MFIFVDFGKHKIISIHYPTENSFCNDSRARSSLCHSSLSIHAPKVIHLVPITSRFIVAGDIGNI